MERHAVVVTGCHRGVEVEDSLVRLSAQDGQDPEARVAGGDEPCAVGAERRGARDDVVEARGARRGGTMGHDLHQ